MAGLTAVMMNATGIVDTGIVMTAAAMMMRVIEDGRSNVLVSRLIPCHDRYRHAVKGGAP
jgi:hypothetical protein